MTKIYATLISAPVEQGDLVLVELPKNCSVDGGPSEMRRDILFLLDYVVTSIAPVEVIERIEEIEKRYR